MRRGTEFHLALAALLFGAVAAALAIMEPLAPKPQREARIPFAVTAASTGDRIRVDWDPSSPYVQKAERATLEVQDGTEMHRYAVDKATLGKGGLDYLKKSNDVLLTVTLHQSGEPDLAAAVRTIAAVSPPASPVRNASVSRRKDDQARTRRR